MTEPTTEHPRDPEREFDEFARSAGSQLKRPAPVGGAARVQQAGDRRRTRTRAGLAAGVLLILVVGVGAFALRGDDGEEEQAASLPPSTDAATAATSDTTDPPATESVSSSSAPRSAPTTTAIAPVAFPDEPRTLTLAELPEATPIEGSASLTLEVGYSPTFGAVDDDSLWVIDSGEGALERHSRADGTLVGTVPDVVPTGTLSLARPLVAFGSVWVPSAEQITRVDPTTMSVTATIPIPGSTIELGTRYISDIAADANGVWALSHVPGNVAAVRIDPAADQIIERVPLGGNARSIAVSDGSLWATHVLGDGEPAAFKVLRFDVATGERLAEIELPFEPGVAVADGDQVWVNGNTWDGNGVESWVVARVDTTSDRLVSVTEIHGPNAIHPGLLWSDMAVAGGDAWVPTPTGLVRIDGDTGSVVARFGDVTGGGVITGGDAMWASDQATRRVYRLDV